MDRKNRQLSESNIYHVVVRGVGRQLIFEDDKDRQEYMQMLLSDVRKRNGLILAWCLMGNHVHLLLQLDMEQIAQVMRRVGSGTHAISTNATTAWGICSRVDLAARRSARMSSSWQLSAISTGTPTKVECRRTRAIRGAVTANTLGKL